MAGQAKDQFTETEHSGQESGGEWSHLLFEALDVHGRGEVQREGATSSEANENFH